MHCWKRWLNESPFESSGGKSGGTLGRCLRSLPAQGLQEELSTGKTKEDMLDYTHT